MNTIYVILSFVVQIILLIIISFLKLLKIYLSLVNFLIESINSKLLEEDTIMPPECLHLR